ncbi:(2Fe-2S)-binding protein [Nocardioides acrostichi]|uniref:Bacterioferritin-associated ferredoxin n=1 Tax=Nocardioides acrostichi TaxID=2784339 RepID=A0A930V4M3_9ACTN|nr:(2Fe-2S)-binding protein [Nocardioides acrostichi]MBF4163665.1 (2Fe-2S)-binding protein [Nocardioides acrostichi]
MIVCHCEVVTSSQVATTLAAGARTVAQVCRATGAGKNCGSCVFSVRRLVIDHNEAEAHECTRTLPQEIANAAS